MEVKEQVLTRILEEHVRTEERLAQAKAPLIEKLGFDRRRAMSLKAGDVVYTGQGYGWVEVIATELCSPPGESEPYIQVVFDLAAPGEPPQLHLHHIHADEFVDVKVDPPQEPF